MSFLLILPSILIEIYLNSGVNKVKENMFQDTLVYFFLSFNFIPENVDLIF